MIRLNKFLSDRGVCSRRRADELIQLGKVFVNGNKIVELGTKIDEEKDLVKVENKLIGKQEEKVYYILNKPAGYITTSSDPHGRKKVTDLVPKIPRVYPVGRLDYSSEGLLVLTNDGDLTNKLTHPRYAKEKVYQVTAKIPSTKSLPREYSGQEIPNKSKIQNPKQWINLLKKGIELKEGIAKADEIKLIEQTGNIIQFSLILHQGWNRQIRRMCEAVGLEVVKLKRIRIGKLKLGGLKTGEWKKISFDEITKT